MFGQQVPIHWTARWLPSLALAPFLHFHGKLVHFLQQFSPIKIKSLEEEISKWVGEASAALKITGSKEGPHRINVIVYFVTINRFDIINREKETEQLEGEPGNSCTVAPSNGRDVREKSMNQPPVDFNSGHNSKAE